MEKVENIHPVLEGIIMDAALKAVDVLLSNVSYLASISSMATCVQIANTSA